MKKRILSMLLAFVMIVGIFPINAMATEGSEGAADGTVYISISFDGKYIDDKNGTPIVYRAISLADIAAVDLTQYGLDNMLYDGDGDGQYDITALQLIIYAHETLYGGDWGNVNFDAIPGSSYFKGGVFGFTENLMYFHNGGFPVDESQTGMGYIVGATSDRIVLQDGDFLDIASFGCFAFLWDMLGGFHAFGDADAAVDEDGDGYYDSEYRYDFAATAGEALSVKLIHSFADLMMGQAYLYLPEDYEVYYGKIFGEAEGSVFTDGDGNAEITFPNAGTYYIWCDGDNGNDDGYTHTNCDHYMETGEPCIVSAPAYAKVTVTGGDEEPEVCTHTATETIPGDPATCTETGLTDGTKCATCGEILVEQEVIPATGHDMQESAAAIAPDCKNTGKTAVLTCANGCGNTEGGEEVAALGHLDENNDNKCDRCTTGLCGEKGHIEETISGKSASCTEEGLTDGKKCSACGEILTEQEVIPATGHDMQESTAAVAPGCENTGKTAVLTCANGCGKTEGGEEVPALGHNSIDGKCTVCGIECEGEQAREAQDVSAVLNATLEQLVVSVPAPAFGTNAGEWTVFSLARGNYFAKDSQYFADYYTRILGTVFLNASKVNMNGALDKNKSTDNSRLIMALSSIGIDATSVGEWDLVEAYSANGLSWIKKQGINGPIWALIALDSGNYETSDPTIRQQCVDLLLSMRHDDGGWSLVTNKAQPSNVDITGMALTALYPYRDQPEVATACAEAIAWLSESQLETGGFPYGNSETSESCAWAIVSLTMWGINPDTDPRFIKNGNSAVDNLLSYYIEEDKMFAHQGTAPNAMATDQASYALVAYDRFVKGEKALYDMSDVVIEKSDEQVKHVEGVTLDITELTLMVGDTAELKAIITPEDATIKTVTWKSSDTKVARVADGKITAKGEGTATITVTTDDGSMTATCTVTVCNHEWVDATCTEPKTCSKCGATEGEANGHTEEIIPGKEATGTEPGLTEGVKCSVCGEVLVEQEEIPMLALAVPTAIVTLNSEDKPVISWNTVEGAEKYELYRATSANGTYTKLATLTTTTATNKNVAEGTTYYYKVRAVAGDAYSEYSAVVSVTVPVKIILTAPTVTVTNNASTGKNVISWTAVAGAEKYEVWGCTTKDGSYSKLGTVTGTSVTHSSAKAGKTYYYKVRAIAGDVKGAVSAAVGKTCDLARPTVTASNNASTGKIVLSWKKIDGADKYVIYRSATKDGTYTKLGTVTGTSATISSAKPGETWYFRVKAICSANSGADSAASVAVGKTCDCARPTLTVKLNAKGKPALSWNAVEGAVKYEIYASTSKDGTYTKLGTVTGTSVAHSSAKSGVTYYYKVKAICSVSGGDSAYSAVAYVTAK